MIIREAHFPGSSPIDSYGNGGFRFADMSHRGSIMCVPSGIYGWSPEFWEKVDIGDFTLIDKEHDSIDVLLIGTGENMHWLFEEWRQWFRERQIIVETMSTGAAVRTFNIMLAEGRQVACSVIAVP